MRISSGVQATAIVSATLGSCCLAIMRHWQATAVFRDGHLHVDPAVIHDKPDSSLDSAVLGETADSLFYFLHITDIHVSKFNRGHGLDHLRFFLQDTIPLIDPQFVTVTGDLVDGKDKYQVTGEQHVEEWQAYHTILVEYNITHRPGFFWRHLRGNHDCFGVAGWNRTNNYYRIFSKDVLEVANASNAFDASWFHVDHFPFGSYAFLALDTWYALN